MFGDKDDEHAIVELGDAIGRLHTFAILHGHDDVIDDTSGLTTQDLNLLLDVLGKVKAISLAAPKL